MLEALVVSAMTCCKSSYLSVLVNCLSQTRKHSTLTNKELFLPVRIAAPVEQQIQLAVYYT